MEVFIERTNWKCLESGVVSAPSKTKSFIQCGCRCRDCLDCLAGMTLDFFLQLGQVKFIRWVLKFCEHCADVAGSSRAGSKSKLRKEPGDPSFTAFYPILPFDSGLAVGARLKGRVVGRRVMGVIQRGTSHEI